MAQKELSLVVTLQDKASRQLQGLQGNLQRMQPAFRKMAAYGTAAFAGVSVAMGKTVKDAGNAEKIANNFETTFGESSDVINSFIGDFGDKFAFVESEMRQGANAIGFQLNAMGEIGKEEGEKIAKSLLTASGGLSDFFGEQMNVTQAAEALAKGLSGNRAQLQEMGFNVYAEDIKNMAEAMGFNTDELTKAQEAQAFTQLIMEQTSGSVGALEKNMDSYTAQMRAVRKASKEASETLGELFLPMATELLERITPIVEKFAEWVSENPELMRNIMLATGAIAGLVAGVGLLGMLLPSIITGFSFLLGPLGMVIALLIPLAKILWDNRDAVMAFIKEGLERLKKVWEGLKPMLMEFWENLKRLWDVIKKSLRPSTDRLIESLKDMWVSVSRIWNMLSPYLIPAFKFLAKVIGTVVFFAIIGLIGLIAKLIEWTAKLVTAIADWYTKSIKKWVDFYERVKELWGKLGESWEGFKENVVELMKNLWKDIKGVWEGIKDAFNNAVEWIMENTIDKLIKGFEDVIKIAKKAKDALSPTKWAKRGARSVAEGARNIASSAADAAARVRGAMPFADGGIVTRPTLGLVGEAGPEAIIPLDQMGRGGTTVNVTVNGDVSGRELVDTVKRAIFQEVNRQIKI